MISARDELLHLVDCLSDEESERALELLEPLTRPGGADDPEPPLVVKTEG